MWISAVSATFLWIFPAVSLWFGELFCGFQRFQLLFWRFFRLFRWVWGAVLGISAVSATFLEIFPAVSLWLGSCFVDFSGFSYFFPEFFQLLGLIWGAVLEVLWITATQATYREKAGNRRLIHGIARIKTHF